MATTTSGLTRRRGGGGGAAGAGDGESNGIGSRTNSSPNVRDATAGPETSYESGENGHRIAFDPRDISESAERSKQPKLTLMEEVLLLGLKDKQVCISACLAFACLLPLLGANINGFALAPD
jgi:Golgi phosphoprotein 3